MTKESENSKQNRGVIKGALAMSSGTLGSRILGFLRDMLLGSLFSRTITDAFVVAFRLPNLFRRLLGEGSLSVSFIPIYIEARKKPQAAADLASSLWMLLLLISSLLSVLGVIFMPQIIRLLVSGDGFMSVPGKFQSTVVLARVMFVYLFLVTSYGYLMAICQSWKKFFLPALAPALFNVAVIVFMFFPAEKGLNLAYGVLAGGVLQLSLVIYQLVKLQQLPQLKWRGFSPELKKVLVNMLPGLLGLGVMQIMAIINVNFASRLGEGSHSYIYWADRILELPQSLIAISLGAALLPTLSELWAQGERQKMLNTLFDNLRVMLFLAFPSAVGMFVLGLPIVQVLFQRGAFTLTDAEQVMSVIQIYSVLLLMAGFVKVFVNGFYAVKNTWFPAMSSAITLCAHIFIASHLTNVYGLKGLVSATVISAGINLSILLIGFYFLVERYSLTRLLLMPLRYVPASAVLFYALYQLQVYAADHVAGGSMAQVIYLFATIAASVLVYFAISHVFKIKEAQVATAILRRKLLKR